MNGSYSSYSSTSAMDIPTRRNSSTTTAASYHASCAFPSWPRRDSLTSDHDVPRASSYISDEDLLFDPVFASSSDEDAHSVTSSCASATPSPVLAPVRHLELAAFREQQAAQQRLFLQSLAEEKEQRRRRAAAKKARSAAAGGKASSKPATTSPTPRSKLSSIVEATAE